MTIGRKMRLICGLLFLSVATEAVAQSAQENLHSDRFVRQTLENDEPKQVAQLLLKFGVAEETANLYGIERQQPSEEKLDWFELRPINGVKARILFLPCAPIAQSTAILLTQSVTGWKIQDTVGFDCHYDNKVSLQMLNLTTAKQFDLVVRHDCVSHGTGYVEQHLEVYRINAGKMQKVLDQRDMVVDYNPPISESQTSIFLPTGLGVLEETRDTVKFAEDDEPILSSLQVERRTFRWSSSLNKFQSTPFRRLR